MSKNNLQSVFILILAGMLSVPCFLAEAIAQDRIPVCPPLGKTAKLIKPLREMNWANDTITVQISFPSAFRVYYLQSASFILATAMYVGISTLKPPVPV